MKPFKALLLTSLVLGACEKSNDITQLHEEAVATAKYFGPRVDDMAKRKQAIFQRGRNVPGNLPDVPEIINLINEAGAKIDEMHGIAASNNGGKSALETQADQLAKDGKLDELRKLIDESAEKLDEDWTIANGDLTKVESWLWQYEQGHANAAPPPQKNPSDTGETPPAAAPEGAGSAAGSAAKVEDKKAPAKADEKKTPDNKAAEKAAGEKADKKAAPKGEPKAGAGSAAAPKAAAPKAGAGSAAK
jgi:hypothetical protein